MTTSEYLARSIEMIKTEWFPNHVASTVDYGAVRGDNQSSRFLPSRIAGLQWANPETSTYLVMYFLHRSTLFVTGDLGHAIYRWSAPETSFDWIARCNYSYFAEKLEGIDGGGRNPAKQWDSHVLELRAAEFFKSIPRDRRFPVAAWRDYAHSRDEWQQFLWENVDKLGYDQASEASELGLVPNNRVIGHWLGLRLALGVETGASVPVASIAGETPGAALKTLE